MEEGPEGERLSPKYEAPMLAAPLECSVLPHGPRRAPGGAVCGGAPAAVPLVLSNLLAVQRITSLPKKTEKGLAVGVYWPDTHGLFQGHDAPNLIRPDMHRVLPPAGPGPYALCTGPIDTTTLTVHKLLRIWAVGAPKTKYGEAWRRLLVTLGILFLFPITEAHRTTGGATAHWR